MAGSNSTPLSPKSAQRFAFIAQSGSKVDVDGKRRAHSHAQANYRRRTAHTRSDSKTVELDVTSLLDQRPQTTTPNDDSAALIPSTVLDANRSDPFDSWGLPGDRHRVARLWDHGQIDSSLQQIANIKLTYHQYMMEHVPNFEL